VGLRRSKLCLPSDSDALNRASKEVPIPIYERLLLLNLYCAASIDLLGQPDRAKVLPPNEASYYAAHVEEVRACASQSIDEYLNGVEIKRGAVAAKKRRRVEKAILK
jgi:hypothetical protein